MKGSIMSDWFDRINGTYGSNTVEQQAKVSGREIAPSSTSTVRQVGSSDDDYVEVNIEDEDVSSLGYEEHTYDELQTMYNNKEGEVQDAEGTLSDLQDNSKNGIADAEKAYDEAVKNDEKVSQELKEKQAENSEAITSKENEISKKESDISSYESDISDCGLNIEHLEAQMSKIQTLLDAQPGIKTYQSDDEWAKIEANKADFQAQISNLKRDIYLEKTKKSNLEDKLKTAKADKETLDGELKDLNETKKEIDTEILKSCSEETKQLKTALDTKKSEVETNKSTAQSNIDTLRGELQEIANYMNNHASLKVDDIKIKTPADVAKDLLGDNKYLEWASVNSAVNESGLDGQELPKGEWCAGFVTYALSEYYGGIDKVPGNFNEEVEHKTWCWDYGGWAREENILMDEREDAENYDLSQVQPGDLILFNKRDPDGVNYDSWAHIGIVTGINDDGSIAYTIEGNTSTTDDSYTQGNYYGDGGVLANKSRYTDGREFASKNNGESLGTSFILLHKLPAEKE